MDAALNHWTGLAIVSSQEMQCIGHLTVLWHYVHAVFSKTVDYYSQLHFCFHRWDSLPVHSHSRWQHWSHCLSREDVRAQGFLYGPACRVQNYRWWTNQGETTLSQANWNKPTRLNTGIIIARLLLVSVWLPCVPFTSPDSPLLLKI